MNEASTAARLEIRSVYTEIRRSIFSISNGGSINLYNPAGDETWMSRVTSNLVALKAFSGRPQIITEITDAIFVPGYNCLYDRDGHRILESCIRRGIELDDIIDAPETISLPDCSVSIDYPLVYLGILGYHWGHFLTESISRLWSLDAGFAIKSKFLFFGGPYSPTEHANNAIRSFLNSGTDRQLISEAILEPVKIRKAFVPSPSFQNRGQAYSEHAAFPHKVADRLLFGQNPKVKSNQPVYLSRSRLSNSPGVRSIRNEAEFELILESLGVLICHPETNTLEEQVVLFNKHRTFIGCWGSALHNLLFILDMSGVTVHVLSGWWRINPNYFLFDAILGMESHYVHCLLPTPGAQQLDGPMIDMYIDIELMLSYLSENQII